jgi:anti-sigma factor RsiW
MARKKATACDLVLERLSAYLDGDLPASECRSIQAHARACARCTEVLGDFRRTTGLCRRAGEQPLPPAVRKLAKAHIRRLME